MKVLQVCEAYGGGVKKHLDLISKVMDSSVENYYYISPSLNETVAIESTNVQIDKNFSNRKNPLHLLNAAKNLLAAVKEIKPDVIHFHSTFAGIVAVLLKPFVKKNIKFVYTPHAYFSQKDLSSTKRMIVCKLEKTILKGMDKVIHVSQQEEQHCFEQNLLPVAAQSKSIVIYNGVEQPSYRKTAKNEEKTVFVNVARCVEQKNPELFLKIAKHYVKLDNSAEFIFVGDGPKLETIKKEISQYGLDEKIKFVGYSTNVQQYLEQADFYLSTSRYEGMPYSVIEAMAMGLPLILSNVIGHSELIVENGALFELDDINKIVEMLSLYSKIDKVEYGILTQESIIHFDKQFNVKNKVQSILKVYKV